MELCSFSRRKWGHSLLPLWSLSLLLLLSGVLGQEPFRRFEYKYSFKPPYLSQKDGTVPFWEHSGSKSLIFILIIAYLQSSWPKIFIPPDAIASEENLRITPSLKSQKGE